MSSKKPDKYMVWDNEPPNPEIGSTIRLCDCCGGISPAGSEHGSVWTVVSKTFELIEVGLVPVLGLVKGAET